jgi:hypothetical protein
VASLGRRLKSSIRRFQEGEKPLPWTANGNPVLTYAGDTVMKFPKSNRDDRAVAEHLAGRVAEIYRGGDRYQGDERREYLKSRLRRLEADPLAGAGA